MVPFFKFNKFVEDVAHGVHSLNVDSLKVFLSNDAPDAALHAVKTDIQEIAIGNGYTGSVSVTITESSETSGVYSLVGSDLIPMVVASGGLIGSFRYVVLYNDTPTSPTDPLIGAWDYGISIVLQDGEAFDVDLSATILTLT